MPSFCALLGRQPSLSIAELASRLPDFRPGHLFGNQFLLFSTEQKIDQAFLSSLGGVILIAQETDMKAARDLHDLPGLLANEVMGIRGKVTFSLRFFGIQRAKGRALLRECKNFLKKDHSILSRYVGNETDPPKAIQLHDEGLLDRKEGCELTILQDKDHFWIGRTIAAQDVKAYTQRDIGKPVRDTGVGLLPPKLAQILLNFGSFLATDCGKEKVKDFTVFDPFCGTGVIPLEAMVRGLHVLASDLSLKAVNGCLKNVEWGRKTYKILKKDTNVTVWKQDACKPFELKTLPHVVVTEGSLGPALSDRPTQKQIDVMIKQAEQLETGFLANCKATLPGVPIVMLWPVWYSQKRPMFLPHMPEIVSKTGYRQVLPPHADPTFSERLSLVYRRPDQFVGREIVLLEPV